MRAVLFDLDGTLLDIDLRGFIDRYFTALSRTIARITGEGPELDRAMAAIRSATDTMMLPHPGRTNREVFDEEFHRLTNIHLSEHWAELERFYAEEFPALGDGYRQMSGARRAVETAQGLGLKVAVATNPIFPRAAVDHRLAWAGMLDVEYDAVTTYEWMHSCKPHASYFRQTAEALDVSPEECLMVGDDRTLDMSASDIGMRTYFVGACSAPGVDYWGNLDELADLLPRLSD